MAYRILATALVASGLSLSHPGVTGAGAGAGDAPTLGEDFKFGPSVDVARGRAPQIFNSVHDAMRQWGSSLHHNGMSLYLATVPKGVIFHHGNNNEKSPTDPDWLAYEIEHAEGFARGGRGPPGPPGKNPGDGPGDGGLPGHSGLPFEKLAAGVDFNLDESQHAMPGDPYSQPPSMDTAEGQRGWLHTYRTTRPLRYLYVDGMGGGKTSMGTLDSQDFLLRGDRTSRTETEKPPKGKRAPHGPMDEQARARELCKMCDRWNLSGIIRMEAGFEIIQCDFYEDGLEQIHAMQRPAPSNGGPGRGPGGPGGFGNFEMIRGLAERYHDIGSSRTIIDFSSMVSAYFYPINLTNPDPKRPDLPRLSNATDVELSAIKAHLTQVIDERRDDSIRTVDWQDVSDLIVGRYADRLKYMAEKVDSLDQLAQEINFLLTVFIDYSVKNSDQVPSAIDRCTNFYLHGVNPVTEADHLIHAAFKTLTSEICNRLFEVRELVVDAETPDSTSLAKAVAVLRSLMDYLQWARFKRCPSCGVDEVCFIPMWPFGSKEDYESPRCVNSSNSRGDGENYWGGFGHGGPGRRPGGGKDGKPPPGHP